MATDCYECGAFLLPFTASAAEQNKQSKEASNSKVGSQSHADHLSIAHKQTSEGKAEGWLDLKCRPGWVRVLVLAKLSPTSRFMTLDLTAAKSNSYPRTALLDMHQRIFAIVERNCMG